MTPSNLKRLVFVDCEAGRFGLPDMLREFGAVHYETRETFHGILNSRSVCMTCEHSPQSHIYEADACRPGFACAFACEKYVSQTTKTFTDFAAWLKEHCGLKAPVFVSDNPAYDWQSINYHFVKILGDNPFGHTARRIGDFYGGLKGHFWKSTGWKRFRVTEHDHHPVHDAMGNVEAFERILRGEL